jgi:general secretion pathway protein C
MLVQFKHRIEGQWFAIAQWTLIALLCLAVAQLVWTAVTPVGPLGNVAPPPLAPADTTVIGRFDPFFRSAAAGPDTSQVSTRALVLLGTRVDAVSGRGSAIIATADGKQSSYIVGEEIEPGLRLQAVAFDNVTLSANGSTEQLFLDQSSGEAPVTPEDAGVVSADLSPGPSEGEAASPVQATATPTTALADAISAVPRLNGGVVDGFTLMPRGNGVGFRLAGLQSGDVLTAVDGTPVRGIGDATALARRLGGGRATLTIERGGKPVTVKVGQ